MRGIFVIFLLAILKSSAAFVTPSVLQTFHKPPVTPATDTLHAGRIDTSTVEKFLGLPEVLKVLTYNVVFISKGEIVQSWMYLGKESSQVCPQLWGFIKKGKRGDKIAFSNIYVMKGDKKIRYPDRTFIIP